VSQLLQGNFGSQAWYDCVVLKNRIFILQFIIIAMVALIHISALNYYLYWKFEWLDLVTHFLAGMWVSLISFWTLKYLVVDNDFTAVKVFAAVLVISIGWEVFELLAGMSPEKNFIFDTSLDLAMDAVGAFTGFMLSKKLVLRDP
jgi:hypothetical protein